MNTQQSFGMTLRARRLGYHEMPGVGFVRIRDGGPPWAVDLAPLDNVPTTTRSGGVHVVWWEGDTRIIEETIRRVAGVVTEPRTIWLDDDGNLDLF